MDIIPFALPKDPSRLWDLSVPIVQSGNTTHIYLTDTIDSPMYYNEVCYRLIHAQPYETFVLNLNTPGGDLDSAIMLLDALSRTKAHTIADLTGSVASAGTMITMGCKALQVARFTSFMIHNYSAQVAG